MVLLFQRPTSPVASSPTLSLPLLLTCATPPPLTPLERSRQNVRARWEKLAATNPAAAQAVVDLADRMLTCYGV